METNFNKVKNYLLDLEYTIVSEDESTGVIKISKEQDGICNMVLYTDGILTMEQALCQIKNPTKQVFEELLKKNRDIIHGAFALGENNLLLFRDTLEIENLDKNEIEGSLNSLGVLLSEYSAQILEFAK